MRCRPLNISVFVCLLVASSCSAQDLTGRWDAEIECRGGAIKFGLDFIQESETWSCHIVNGNERIKVPRVTVEPDSLTLNIDHYDSKIVLRPDLESEEKRLLGTWKKRRGPEKWSTMKCSAVPHVDAKLDSPTQFLGRWSVKFESSDDPAVGIFQKSEKSNQVLGTFLTTTGDYRFLAGRVFDNDKLELSCFDGAHAFLFQATIDRERTLQGDFWSSSTWHETWSASWDPDARLPDDFKQTSINESVDLGGLSFPDLTGKQMKLNDPKFAGKARIIYVFGSWCPNCHDAGEYFAALDKKYGPQGLSILGLAFELTGDFERDAEQVKKYLKRHGSSYPVLVAGLADKAKASQALPILDRVRSYPTTIFLDGNGNVKAVHTGFTGPATGDAFEQLKEKFKSLIAESLAESK